jgi:hypothetical protein
MRHVPRPSRQARGCSASGDRPGSSPDTGGRRTHSRSARTPRHARLLSGRRRSWPARPGNDAGRPGAPPQPPVTGIYRFLRCGDGRQTASAAGTASAVHRVPRGRPIPGTAGVWSSTTTTLSHRRYPPLRDQTPGTAAAPAAHPLLGRPRAAGARAGTPVQGCRARNCHDPTRRAARSARRPARATAMVHDSPARDAVITWASDTAGCAGGVQSARAVPAPPVPRRPPSRTERRPDLRGRWCARRQSRSRTYRRISDTAARPVVTLRDGVRRLRSSRPHRRRRRLTDMSQATFRRQVI